MSSAESQASFDKASEMSASTAESFVMADPSPSATTTLPPQEQPRTQAVEDDDEEDLDSLPSISTSVLSPSDLGSDSSDAQREWEASLEQLQLLLTMILVPFAGKFMGRKIAYWSWARYMEWAHDVDIQWTSKKKFAVAGAVEAAATL